MRHSRTLRLGAARKVERMTRVVAGLAGGRRLVVPAGEGTRPTSERAREGMFSSLQSLLDLQGARVLDLYAGSGALGFEALSRGAVLAVLVDSDPRAVAALRSNADTLGLPGVVVVDSPVERFLDGPPAPVYSQGFDLAVLDPPYDDDVAPVLSALLPWLAPGAVVVVERRARGPELGWPAGLEPVRDRRYGAAVLRYALRP